MTMAVRPTTRHGRYPVSLDPATLNPVACERELLRFVGLLEHATQETARRGRAAAEAEVAHRVAYAKAIIAAQGTVAEREALATVATEQELLARRLAEASLDASRDASRNMREQLGALRTVSANLRELVTS